MVDQCGIKLVLDKYIIETSGRIPRLLAKISRFLVRLQTTFSGLNLICTVTLFLTFTFLLTNYPGYLISFCLLGGFSVKSVCLWGGGEFSVGKT